jgi:hypothetical protein
MSSSKADFNDLMQKHNKSQQERLLILCIALLSTTPQYSSNTPWEVYEDLCRREEATFARTDS